MYNNKTYHRLCYFHFIFRLPNQMSAEWNDERDFQPKSEMCNWPVNKIFTTRHVGSVVREQKECLPRHLMGLWRYEWDLLAIVRQQVSTSAKRLKGRDLAWKSRILLSMPEVCSVLTDGWDACLDRDLKAKIYTLTIAGRDRIYSNAFLCPFGG